MPITKQQKIKYINVQELKPLQIIGSKQIIENGVVIAESELAFALVPTETVADRQEYKDLPAKEQAIIDDLVPLLTDEVKAAYSAHLRESTP